MTSIPLKTIEPARSVPALRKKRPSLPPTQLPIRHSTKGLGWSLAALIVVGAGSVSGLWFVLSGRAEAKPVGQDAATADAATAPFAAPAQDATAQPEDDEPLPEAVAVQSLEAPKAFAAPSENALNNAYVCLKKPQEQYDQELQQHEILVARQEHERQVVEEARAAGIEDTPPPEPAADGAAAAEPAPEPEPAAVIEEAPAITPPEPAADPVVAEPQPEPPAPVPAPATPPAVEDAEDEKAPTPAPVLPEGVSSS